jgi:glycosyltransferase involved in cell wall biosynthesis
MPLPPSTSPLAWPPVRVAVYLADQNPGFDRSFGISRMSQMALSGLSRQKGFLIETIVSTTSQQAPAGVGETLELPWGTRRKLMRLLTDHIHPLLSPGGGKPDVFYFPKGFLPLLNFFCQPSVVTIHDTILQYGQDHYPKWRSRWEYKYWARMLKHTLKRADRILTVSKSSEKQIREFMVRHGIREKEITITYESCAYEAIPQPVDPAKENYVIHLASSEPHKRTAHLVRWWHEAESQGRELPMLHLIGTVPSEVSPLLASSRSMMHRPFLEESALQSAYQSARALILPSEIEGFGLPALEAYYLGTPVCFVQGTSVEEILGVTTRDGGFSLDDPDSMFGSLESVMAMEPAEVRQHGLTLRETYASEKVYGKMAEIFRAMATGETENFRHGFPR